VCKVQGPPSAGAAEFQAIKKIKNDFPVTVKIRTYGYQTLECFIVTLPTKVGKTLTDLQILGCKLHKNAFGGRALPGPAGEL